MVPPHPLNERTLAHHAARVAVPAYDRRRLQRGVVHLGVGGFHRSHQAVYFDRLAGCGLGDGWALTGVGLHHREMKEALDPQDGLYTVVARGLAGDSARVVGIITRYLYAREDREAVVRELSDPRTHLVTLTITANGYDLQRSGAAVDGDRPACIGESSTRHDAGSALGLIVDALQRRRRSATRPFTVLSCDNFADNGAVARGAVMAMAAAHDPSLADWVDEHVAFPGSLVDRITPATTSEDRKMVETRFGVRDRWPVVAEPFSQWVVEDAFCSPRPPLEAAGVQFVDDVRPHALIKTRLLNATHCAVGYLGSLAGYNVLDEAMADDVFDGYVRRVADVEIAPLLPPVGIDLVSYTETMRQRFSNPAIADRLVRICRNGSTKIPAHLLPSIREARALGRPHPMLTLAVAAWCRYLRGVDERGRRIDINDPQAARLRHLALAAAEDARPLLAEVSTFGALGRDPGFAELVERDIRDLATNGVRAVLGRRVCLDTGAAAA